MPLPPASPRQHLHTRTLDLQGYLREDGLWDIEGHLRDTKTYAFHNEWRGEMTPGMAVHDMSIRITVDDAFIVRDVETVFDASPFPICPAIAPNFKRLVGLTIGKGWNRRVKERLGGIEGCTHLVELLGPMATVALQTIRPFKRLQAQKSLEPGTQDTTTHRPQQIDTCHAWASDSPVVKRWMPEFYTGSER